MTGGTEVQYGGSRLGQDVLARQDRKKRIQKILTKYGVQSAGRVTGIPVTVGKGQLTLGKRVEKKQEGRSVVPYAQSAGIASNTAMPYAAGQQKAEIAPKRDPKPIEKPAAVLPDYFGKSAAELESMQEQTMGEKRELDRQIGALTCQGPYATKAGIVESTGTPYGAMAQATRESGYDYGRMKGFEERLEKARAYREGQEHTAQFAQEHPVLASGITIPAGTIQGLDYFGQLLGNVGHNDAENLGSYVPLDVYDTHATNFVRTVRGTVAQKLEENSYLQTELGGQNVASFLYRTGMSMGDFLFNSMITGNFSGGLGGAGAEQQRGLHPGSGGRNGGAPHREGESGYPAGQNDHEPKCHRLSDEERAGGGQ